MSDQGNHNRTKHHGKHIYATYNSLLNFLLNASRIAVTSNNTFFPNNSTEINLTAVPFLVECSIGTDMTHVNEMKYILA